MVITMKRIGVAIFAGAVALSAIPAWAQQNTPPGSNPAPMYDYGRMWHHGWGWHAGMFLAPFILLLALIGMVALIAWLVRWINHGSYHHGHHGCPHCGYGSHRHGRAALDILEERFARGEIDKAEFEEKRKLLGR